MTVFLCISVIAINSCLSFKAAKRRVPLQMFFDLNLLWSCDGEKITEQQLRNALHELEQLGYTHCCVNTLVRGKSLPNTLSTAIPKGSSSRIHCYSRITLELDDQHANYALTSNPLVQQFDVVAVVPKSEKAFQLACSTLDIDMISLDLSSSGGRLPFNIKNNLVGEAISRGVFFEVSYSAALNDAGQRRNLFGNMVPLVRATKGGRNVVISSGASEPIDFRAPQDIINMAFMLGLNGDAPHKSLTLHPKELLLHAATRKHTCKSAISLNTDPLTRSTTDKTKTASLLHEDFIKIA